MKRMSSWLEKPDFEETVESVRIQAFARELTNTTASHELSNKFQGLPWPQFMDSLLSSAGLLSEAAGEAEEVVDILVLLKGGESRTLQFQTRGPPPIESVYGPGFLYSCPDGGHIYMTSAVGALSGTSLLKTSAVTTCSSQEMLSAASATQEVSSMKLTFSQSQVLESYGHGPAHVKLAGEGEASSTTTYHRMENEISTGSSAQEPAGLMHANRKHSWMRHVRLNDDQQPESPPGSPPPLSRDTHVTSLRSVPEGYGLMEAPFAPGTSPQQMENAVVDGRQAVPSPILMQHRARIGLPPAVRDRTMSLRRDFSVREDFLEGLQSTEHQTELLRAFLYRVNARVHYAMDQMGLRVPFEFTQAAGAATAGVLMTQATALKRQMEMIAAHYASPQYLAWLLRQHLTGFEKQLYASSRALLMRGSREVDSLASCSLWLAIA
ncbi:unnamed protein product [Amoebophrya sp. A25]|nr:unnamed protein product [Amoebophrya sp. A25]|eukprot:GSA25T00004059001.1